jgi:hypothetical protein
MTESHSALLFNFTEFFKEWMTQTVCKGSTEEKAAMQIFMDKFCSTPEAVETCLSRLQTALREWNEMQNSVIDIVRNGTEDMVSAYVSLHPEEVSKLFVRGSDTVTPLTEAVKRGDSDVLNAVLAVKPDLCVSERVQECGCGIVTEEESSPLALALIARNRTISVALIRAHSEETIKADPGKRRNSSFDGEMHQSVLDLAKEWGDTEVLHELKAKGIQ